MGDNKNGDPAFPTQVFSHMAAVTEPGRMGGPFVAEKVMVVHPGMSLRQYYAAAALQGIISAYSHPNANGTPRHADAAQWAFEYADAMLSEENKNANS